MKLGVIRKEKAHVIAACAFIAICGQIGFWFLFG